jgi:type IV fimbrial biogenesis protein FimT
MRPADHPPLPPRGFTLIEALIVVGLLGVLIAVALPSWRQFTQRRQLEGASAQLLADLQFLRSTSVARNVALRLSFHASAAGSCYLIHTGETAQCRCSFASGAEPDASCSGGAELLRGQLLGGSRLDVRANVASMRIDPRHGTISPTGTIELQAGDSPTLRHIVNILGRARLCSVGTLPGVGTC